MTFHVGQKVVCVNDRRLVSVKRGGWLSRFRPFLKLDHNLNRDHIYLVTRVQVFPTHEGPHLALVNVDKARHFEYPDVGFPAFQFRALIERETKTDISILKKLLDPKRRELPSRVIAKPVRELTSILNQT